MSSGAYPAEVLPSQIYDSAASREQKALPSLLVDEIRTAAESVDVGYSRIIRLCRRISQVVRGSTWGIWFCVINCLQMLSILGGLFIRALSRIFSHLVTSSSHAASKPFTNFPMISAAIKEFSFLRYEVLCGIL